MTSKKEGKENPSQDEEVNEENPQEVASKPLEQEEIKQLEGKEPGKLEYFSKDELLENLAKFEVELKTLKEKYDKIEEEKNSWKGKYTRLQAEFENAEKRWNKNRQNLRIEYTASTLKTFLPLYDSFKKALDSQDENNKILKGFYDQFMNILKSQKAQPIEVKKNNPFDYNYHEALSSIERDDVPENTILDVIQDGWKLDKDVIRYAKVIISKKPKPPEPEIKKEEKKSEENSEPENKQDDISSDEKGESEE